MPQKFEICFIMPPETNNDLSPTQSPICLQFYATIDCYPCNRSCVFQDERSLPCRLTIFSSSLSLICYVMWSAMQVRCQSLGSTVYTQKCQSSCSATAPRLYIVDVKKVGSISGRGVSLNPRLRIKRWQSLEEAEPFDLCDTICWHCFGLGVETVQK